MSEQAAMKKEGARGFAVVIGELEDGALHTELSEKLQSLVAKLTDYASYYSTSALGKLSLELNMKIDEAGVATIVSSVKVVEPKRKRSPSTMYASPGNNLTVANPKQLKLGVREVPSLEKRDVPAAAAEVRGV